MISYVIERRVDRILLLCTLVTVVLPACSNFPPPNASAQPNALVEGDTGHALDEYLKEAEQAGFSGAALVAVDGEIVLSKGYGWADRENEIPYTSDTVFSVGSITKQFTAAAILKLVEEGKLSLGQTLAQFFPEAPRDKQNITVHQLLTHTSGLPSDVGGDFDGLTNEQFLARVFASRLTGSRGQAPFRYSNIGYSLLGFIVERASGMSYESYLADRFFVPLGMSQTGYTRPAWPKERIARGYRKNGSSWGSPLEKPWGDDGPYWGLKANGGILSTVGDMYRWVTALRNGEALSYQSIEKLWTGYVIDAKDVSPPPMYGYGWRIITTKRGLRLISHNGSNDIFFASVRIFPDEDVVMILASNAEDQPTWRYEQPGMWDIVFGSG